MSSVPIPGTVVAIIPRPGPFRQLTIETDMPLVPRSKKQTDRELYPWFAQATWEQMVIDRDGVDRVLGARVAYTNQSIAFLDDPSRLYPLHVGDGPRTMGGALGRLLKFRR